MSLRPFENATLIFQVATGTAIDPATGNTVPTTRTEVYRAALQDRGAAPNLEQEPGADRLVVTLEGRLTEPHVWSERIRPGMVAQATWRGLEGRFELLPQVQLEPGQARILRQRVRGTFRMIGGGSRAN